MGWRVRWTTPAWTDVEEIARFIARDSPRYAIVLQREAQAAASSLRQFGDERLRELIVGRSYRLIYRIVADETVQIIAVVHTARDLGAFLQREERI